MSRQVAWRESLVVDEEPVRQVHRQPGHSMQVADAILGAKISM